VYLILTNLWGVIIGALVCFMLAVEVMCVIARGGESANQDSDGQMWTALWYASDGIMSFAAASKSEEDGMGFSSTNG
jgi:hypothetical protein